jgi:hypothetical protein
MRKKKSAKDKKVATLIYLTPLEKKMLDKHARRLNTYLSIFVREYMSPLFKTLENSDTNNKEKTNV